MAKIISERERKEHTTYYLDFRWSDDMGAGFSFDCDKQGHIKTDLYAAPAMENLIGCLTGDGDFAGTVYLGIAERTQRWTEDAVLKCDCGEHVSLGSFTNTCDKCGADYNMNGDRLAPREQWGEETGEHWSDCL